MSDWQNIPDYCPMVLEAPFPRDMTSPTLTAIHRADVERAFVDGANTCRVIDWRDAARAAAFGYDPEREAEQDAAEDADDLECPACGRGLSGADCAVELSSTGHQLVDIQCPYCGYGCEETS